MVISIDHEKEEKKSNKAMRNITKSKVKKSSCGIKKIHKMCTYKYKKYNVAQFSPTNAIRKVLLI